MKRSKTELENAAIRRYKSEKPTENVVTAYKDGTWEVVHVVECNGTPKIVGQTAYSVKSLEGW